MQLSCAGGGDLVVRVAGMQLSHGGDPFGGVARSCLSCCIEQYITQLLGGIASKFLSSVIEQSI